MQYAASCVHRSSFIIHVVFLFFQVFCNLSADLQQRDLAKFGVIFCGEDAFFCIQQTLLCFTYLKTGKVSLGLILLIVPAINVSGLISSQMSRRMAELAVRKAYGASRSTLMVQLLRENLALAFAGALLGFLFSCIFLWLGKDWMLGDGAPGTNFDVSVWLFLRPAVFVAVLVVCLLFNLLSVFIPAWHATRRPIAEVLGGE